MSLTETAPSSAVAAVPRCAVFGQCGGCKYQDISYEAELGLKQEQVRQVFVDGLLRLPESALEPIAPSPDLYGYRTNLDLTFIRTRQDNKYLLGFMKERSKRHIVTIDACPIARPEISALLPELCETAGARLPDSKRLANLAVKAAGDGRVRWGGIGKRSLTLPPSELLWADICGKRIYFSLDTFFQANTGILPRVRERMLVWTDWDPSRTVFYDLYAGVGLFSFLMSDHVKQSVMIEWVGPSIDCARHTIETGGYRNVEIRMGRTEAELPRLLSEIGSVPADAVALVDPPRRGLSPAALESLDAASALGLERLFYLSCGIESLDRDLRQFVKRGWTVEKLGAFDFFPRTKHIETLAFLTKRKHG